MCIGWNWTQQSIYQELSSRNQLLFFFFHICWLLFKYCCLHFPPTPTIPSSHPWSYLPLVLPMCPLYMFLKILPPIPPLHPAIISDTSVSPLSPCLPNIPFFLRMCLFPLNFHLKIALGWLTADSMYDSLSVSLTASQFVEVQIYSPCAQKTILYTPLWIPWHRN